MAATRPRPERALSSGGDAALRLDGPAVEPPARAPSQAGAGRRPSEAGAGRWPNAFRRVADRSLRTRLIAAFAAIIFLTLALVVIGFLFILRQYQEQRELIRLSALASPVAFQVRALEQQGATPANVRDFLTRQADELDVRMVLLGPRAAITFDTDGSLVGQQLNLGSAERFGPLRRARLAGPPGVQDPRVFFVAVGAGGGGAGDRVGRPGGGLLALVSQPRTVWDVLREMAPRLAAAASVSLLASIVVAWVLAASIARPLARMTRAAEAISRGQYEQQIPDHGSDEVGRLSAAFNAMAREVARSQRTLRDFVANVSHDLRTPLTSIQGFSQAMVDGALHAPEEYSEAGRVVNEEAGRMRRLVEDLLELSKIESGQVVLNLAEHDLGQIAAQAAERAERRVAERGVSLDLAVESSPLVRADGRWLERAVDNLVDNAARHTPAGGEITLTVGRQPDDGRPFLRVHNTGSYIPSDELPRLFERFYQLDKSRAGSAEGSGLGLAIAREIVQAHGGRIVAESSRTGGTAFGVILPQVGLRRLRLDRIDDSE